ncbi:uncharacterized protein LOC143883603 [Tasmannia lanceolata]|uniref:uncharacterized protein LOC143883603 n=1 Tax=Tasmannia lanceolata TaxID=3420 RepID=UPI0040648141
MPGWNFFLTCRGVRKEVILEVPEFAVGYTIPESSLGLSRSQGNDLLLQVGFLGTLAYKALSERQGFSDLFSEAQARVVKLEREVSEKDCSRALQRKVAKRDIRVADLGLRR